MMPSPPSGRRKDIPLLLVVCLGLVLPSLSIGLLSDDFSWLRIVRDTGSLGWADYLKIPSPYGYLRPSSMALFRIVGLAFPNAVWPFRALMISLHLAVCLLVYILGKRTGLEGDVMFLTVLLFAVLPCHAESLFWISALNEPLASLLVLSGLLLLLQRVSAIRISMAVALLTVALGTRESSFSYLPMLFLLCAYKPELRKPSMIPVLLLPGAIYLASRYLWSSGLPPGMPVSSPGELSLNPLEMGRRLFHYLVSMALPVKSVFEVTGFSGYESLRSLLASPSHSPAVYWSVSILGVLSMLALIFLLLRRRDWRPLGALAFTVLALGVYLPFRNTSEHFLYFPSIGVCVALALFLIRILRRRPRAGLVAFALIFFVYLVSYANRVHRWHGASSSLHRALSGLHEQTRDIPEGAKVLAEGLTNRYYGIPYIGEHSLNDAWSYLHPGRELTFYFDQTGKDRYLVVLDPEDQGFRRVR